MKKQWDEEFITLFNRLTGKRSNWEVWNDFLTISVIAYANMMPTSKWEERERRYLSAIESYDNEELELLSRLLYVVTMALEDNPKQDFLGDLYTSLNLNQYQKGQHFIPYGVADFMAKVYCYGDLQASVEQKGFVSVSDPTCGSGTMLMAFANEVRNHGLNYQEKVLFVAQDIDTMAAEMCYIQLTLLGCSACIIIGDTLVKPGFHPDNEVYYTPFYYLNAWRFCEKPVEEEACASDMIVEAAIQEPTVSMEKIWEDFQEDANGQFSFDFLNAS